MVDFFWDGTEAVGDSLLFLATGLETVNVKLILSGVKRGWQNAGLAGGRCRGFGTRILREGWGSDFAFSAAWFWRIGGVFVVFVFRLLPLDDAWAGRSGVRDDSMRRAVGCG